MGGVDKLCDCGVVAPSGSSSSSLPLDFSCRFFFSFQRDACDISNIFVVVADVVVDEDDAAVAVAPTVE